MSKVKLWCGVYHKDTVFSVRIQSNATVEDLQIAIVKRIKKLNRRFNVDFADLNLYFAKKRNEDGTWAQEWLKQDTNLKPWLLKGRQEDDMYEEMMAGWNLQKYLGEKFDLGEEAIHILVELRQDMSLEPATKKIRVEVEWKPEEPLVYSLDNRIMYFVNRELATKQLYKIHEGNYARARHSHGSNWVIPIVDNVVGLGKSCFGQHYIKKIKEFSDMENAFKRTIDACHTVHVVFNMGEMLQAKLDAIEMERSMIKILIETLEPMFVQPPAILSSPPEQERSYKFLRNLTREVGPLFIVLDEIGMAFFHASMNSIEQREAFIFFCENVLGNWLQIKNVFFLVAGRAQFFSYVGQRFESDQVSDQVLRPSPFQFERIKLNLLRKEKIKLILTHTAVTHDCQDTIAKQLELTEAEIDLAASVLYKQTNGHPRSLLDALAQCKTKNELLKFEQPMFLPVNQWPNFYAALLPYKETLLKLLNAAEANEAAEADEAAGETGLTRTVDLTTKTPLVGGLQTTWDIVASKACIVWEGELSAAIVRVHPHLKAHLECWFLPCRTYVERIAKIEGVSINYPNAFEWMCLKRFQEIFYEERQPSKVMGKFFNTPKFGECTNVKFTSFTSEMPKVTPCAKSNAAINSLTVSPNDCKTLLRDADDMICYKPRPMSSSPDAFLLTKAQFRNRRVKLVCGLAVKNYRTSSFNENDLKNEMKKFSQLLAEPNVNELRILFVCSTKYTKTLLSECNVGDQWFGVYPIPNEYANIDEVIVLDLQSSDQKEVFFGVEGAFSTTLENVIRKTEVEFQSSNDEAQ